MLVEEDDKDKALELLKIKISDLEDQLVSAKAECAVFQAENHRLMVIMVEKGYLTDMRKKNG